MHAFIYVCVLLLLSTHIHPSQQKVSGVCGRGNHFSTGYGTYKACILCKRKIFTWLSSPGGWCSILSPRGPSSKYQTLSDFPRVSSEDDGWSPPESHKKPVLRTTASRLPNNSQLLRLYFCEECDLTLISSGLSNGLGGSTKHRKFLTASLGSKQSQNRKSNKVECDFWIRLSNATTHTCWWRLCVASTSAEMSAARSASWPEIPHHSCLWTSA